MGSRNHVEEKIGQVIETFQSAQQIEVTINQNELVEKLNSYDPEFRSVAFESAFVSIVSSDFQKNEGVEAEKWKPFFTDFKSLYEAQLVVGFGWALAVNQKNPADFLDRFDPLAAMWILDGYGYYHALLRSRTTVHNLQIPDAVNEALLFAFDQGLGRGLWYLCKGDLEKLRTMLEKFPEERRPDLWRGIGTASAFVAGIDAAKYMELKHLAGNDYKQLIAGVLFSIRSRVRSGSITEGIQIACQALTYFNLQAAFEFVEDSKKEASVFKEWLSEMLNRLKV